MAEVWLSELGFLRKQYALKIPTAHLVNKADVLKEAEVWNAALPHDHIVPIFEASEYDGRVVIATEYYPDGSLHDWLARSSTPLGSDRVAKLMLGILEGLGHLHTLPDPIIHRDLKPANILLKGDKPLIADFGIARFMDSTLTGRRMGSLYYMPPEAFDEECPHAETRDVWAAGVIFYELLTGRRPFPQSQENALIRAILSDEPEALTSSVPEPLCRVVKSALQKDPTHRFKSAVDMKEALVDALHEIQSIDEYLKRGDECMGRGDYDSAIRWYSDALQLRPADSHALIHRGDIYLTRRDVDRALLDFGAVIQVDPNYALAYYGRSLAFFEKGDNDQAIAECKRAIALQPKNARYHYSLGQVYLRKGEYDLAIDSFFESSLLNPGDANSTYNVGVAHLKKGYTVIHELIQLHPNQGFEKRAAKEFRQLDAVNMIGTMTSVLVSLFFGIANAGFVIAWTSSFPLWSGGVAVVIMSLLFSYVLLKKIEQGRLKYDWDYMIQLLLLILAGSTTLLFSGVTSWLLDFFDIADNIFLVLSVFLLAMCNIEFVVRLSFWFQNRYR